MTKPANSSIRRSKVGEQSTKPANSSIRRSKVGEQSINMRIYRLYGGKKWAPATDREGFYVLGDPRAGGEKHHKTNKVRVRLEQEAVDLIRRGYSIRVQTDSAPSLVRKNLFIDGVMVA